MKKRVGILTFHRANNYGAVLQAYALQSFLLYNGYEVYIIDYIPPFLSEAKSIYLKKRFKNRSILGKIKEFIISPFIHKRRVQRAELFKSFVLEHLKLISIDQLEIANLDFIVVGSDQIWNTKLTEGRNKFYGGYNKIKSEKWISYAASIGNCSIEDKNLDIWKEYLNNFDEISVREQELIKIFEPLIRKPIINVLDPVLLVDGSVWDELLLPQSTEKYILVYQIHSDENVLQIAGNLAKEYGCKVIQLASKIDLFQGSEVKENVLVQEFISLFKYAECIVTTSFHGTVFSIINQKPFYTIRMGGGIDTRSEDLLESLGLFNQLINRSERPTSLDIDYSLVEQNLENLKNSSSSFLLNNLS